MVVLTDVIFFRMAPPTRNNPDRNDGEQSNPPPPEAWQALMAATNTNTQMLIQLMQERNQGQGNQGNQGQGNNNNQPLFATLNQFLANQPKSFSACVEAMDADNWLVDINKHFECSNVRPEDYVKFASCQLKRPGSRLVAAVQRFQRG